MNIQGFQKMTLLDFPGFVACTVFTGGCNLRCPFCHNALLVTKLDNNKRFSPDEILSFLSKREGLLDGVCITGGEPLLQPDITSFLKKIRTTGLKIKIDTNGSFPDKLMEIVNSGLVDYIAMDIKNSFNKYPETVGIKNFDVSSVKKSIGYIMNCGVDYEFRTTVVREFHEVSDIVSIAEYISGAEHYFLQNFVDSGELIGNDLHPVDKSVLYQMSEKAGDYVKHCSIRGI